MISSFRSYNHRRARDFQCQAHKAAAFVRLAMLRLALRRCQQAHHYESKLQDGLLEIS